MSTSSAPQDRHRQFKNAGRHEDSRRRRVETSVELRNQKKVDQFMKRRNVDNDEVEAPEDDLAMLSPEGKENIPRSTDPLAIAEVIKVLQSGDFQKCVEAVESVRRLLSRQKNPPIDRVIQAGIVPYLIEAVKVDNSKLQFEACWALTNIVSGTAEQAAAVVNAGAIPVLVGLLGATPELYVAEQITWCLGNVAGDCAALRELVAKEGVIQHFVALASRGDVSDKFQQTLAWAISNLCRYKNPLPSIDHMKQLMPAIVQLLQSPDVLTASDACWALSYITDGSQEHIQLVVDAEIMPLLVKMLQHASARMVGPALRVLGNIVTGNDEQTQAVVASNVLMLAAGNLLDKGKPQLVEETLWMISNIAAGNPQQIQAIINASLIPKIVFHLEKGDFKVQNECASWVISNFATSASADQIHFLLNSDVIRPLCGLLTVKDVKIVTVVLDALRNFLQYATKVGTVGNLTFAIEECGGLDKLEELQQHQSEDIYNQALHLIEEYFGENENVRMRTKFFARQPNFMGQNIKERAVVSTEENESSPEAETLSTCSANHVPTSFAEAGTANTGTAMNTSSNTNGSVSLLHDKLNAIQPDQPSGSAVGGRSGLSGDPIKVITGEESETNVLHAPCQLYAFDKDKEIWAERGLGMLHVNDKGSFRSKDFASRVVMRAQGSLRVILNSKIWSGAVLERAGEESLRLSANDFETGGITAYLITANAKDSQEIEECIRNRILRAKELEEEQEASRAISHTVVHFTTQQSDLKGPDFRISAAGLMTFFEMLIGAFIFTCVASTTTFAGGVFTLFVVVLSFLVAVQRFVVYYYKLPNQGTRFPWMASYLFAYIVWTVGYLAVAIVSVDLAVYCNDRNYYYDCGVPYAFTALFACISTLLHAFHAYCFVTAWRLDSAAVNEALRLHLCGLNVCLLTLLLFEVC